MALDSACRQWLSETEPTSADEGSLLVVRPHTQHFDDPLAPQDLVDEAVVNVDSS